MGVGNWPLQRQSKLAFGDWMPLGHSLSCDLVSGTAKEPLQTLLMQYNKQITWQNLERTPIQESLFLSGTFHNPGKLYFQNQHSGLICYLWVWRKRIYEFGIVKRISGLWSWCPMKFFQLINFTGISYIIGLSLEIKTQSRWLLELV